MSNGYVRKFADVGAALCALAISFTVCGCAGKVTRSDDSPAPGGTADVGAPASLADAKENPPPVTVLPCAQLSASAGWEKITPPGDLGDSQAFQLDPSNLGTIFVQMHKGGNGNHSPTDGLYMSPDCGSTWKKVAQGRNATDPGTNINSGSFSGFAIDPIDPRTMYVVSNYGPGGVWKSTNGGVDWDQVIPMEPGRYINALWLNSLDMDRSNHRHLAAANHAGCSGPFAPNCIAETRDAGASWKLVPAPIPWAEGNGVYIINDTTLLFGTNEGGLYLTTDDGQNWKKVAAGASSVGTGLPPYVDAGGTYYLASAFGIISSSDLVTWTTLHPGFFQNVVGTGSNLIASTFYKFEYFIGPVGTTTDWSLLERPGAPATGGSGGVFMAYDSPHHLVYSSNYFVGLWRLVAQ